MDFSKGVRHARKGDGAPLDWSHRDQSTTIEHEPHSSVAKYRASGREVREKKVEGTNPHVEPPSSEAFGSALRVALMTGNFITVPDGVSRTLTRLVDYLQTLGHDVMVVGPRGADGPQSAGCNYFDVASIPMPGRPEYHLAMGLPKRVRRRLDRFEPDIIHVATPDLLGLGALHYAGARRLPIVATYHTHFPSYLRYYQLEILRRPVEGFLRWFYSRVSEVYAPTPRIASYLKDLGIRGQVRLWGRGVDGDRFHPKHRSTTWRRKHGIGPNDVVVTFVGRLVREKGLDIFEEVTRRLEAEHPAVRSLIVGDGPLRQKLEIRMPHTLFLGHVEGKELSVAYASSDIFLFPSMSEAFGNVIVEAMASGLPVVAAADAGSSSHVIPGRTGYLAKPDDVPAFVSRVTKLLVSADRRRTIGMNARRHAETYDWPRTLARMVRYYSEAATKNSLERAAAGAMSGVFRASV